MNLRRLLPPLALTFVLVSGLSAQVPVWPKTTPAEVTAAGTSASLLGADFGNNTFVLVGNATGASAGPVVFTSPDGAKWVKRALPVGGLANLPRFLNGKFFLGVQNLSGGGNGTILSSADGITWTSSGVIGATINAPGDWAFGNGVYLATAPRSGSVQILTSTDGTTWTPRSIVAGSQTSHVTFFKGRFYATIYNASPSSSNGMYSSQDGATWQKVTGSPDGPGILSGGTDALVTTFFSGTTSGQAVSKDGSNFTTASPGIVLATETIRFLNGSFVTNVGATATSSDLTLTKASADGNTWVTIGSTANKDYAPEVAFGNGTYLFVGKYDTYAGTTTLAPGSGTPPAAPTITTQPPASSSVAIGGSITFTITITGTGVTYQWYFNGVAIAGAINASLVLNNLTVANTGSYTVVVTNAGGSITSSAAVLNVTGGSGVTLPVIATQPLGHAVMAGNSVVFTVNVAGSGLLYQWYRAGIAIVGATSSQLYIPNVQAAIAGSYTVTVTNSAGSVTSSAATLAVRAPGSGVAPRGINLSVRTLAGTGDNSLIVGAVIGGAGTSGAKPLLIRAAGPTLGNYGVAGFLADPTLDFFAQGNLTPLASNDNWGGDAQVTSVSNAVGAFPFASATSKDAALYLTPTAGVFSMKVSSPGGASGVALAEIYDASGLAYTASTPRFINFSARAPVGTGDGVLIAGFVIEGSAERTVLIRAVGPTLSTYGVTGTLADPQLELTQSVGGATVSVASNDNWGGDAQLASVAATVGAFSLGASSKDAAILVTLPPGVYSAKVSGVGNTTGVALVEVYEIP